MTCSLFYSLHAPSLPRTLWVFITSSPTHDCSINAMCPAKKASKQSPTMKNHGNGRKGVNIFIVPLWSRRKALLVVFMVSNTKESRHCLQILLNPLRRKKNARLAFNFQRRASEIEAETGKEAQNIRRAFSPGFRDFFR